MKTRIAMYGRLRVLGVPSFRQVVDEERDKKFIVSFLSTKIANPTTTKNTF